MVIIDFADRGTEHVFNGISSLAARQACPQALLKAATRKLNLLDSAVTLDDLAVPAGNQLEALSGIRLGQHRIRIDELYQIRFRWSELGASGVEIIASRQ